MLLITFILYLMQLTTHIGELELAVNQLKRH